MNSKQKTNLGSPTADITAGSTVLLVACTMAIMALQSSNNGLSSVLNDFTSFYNRSFTDISMMGTLVFVFALPMNFLAGRLIEKIGLKTCCIMATAGIALFGCLPGLIPVPFEALLVVRACFGLFYGLGIPLGLTVATWYFDDADKRASVIGWSMAIISLFNIVFSVGAASLAQINISLVWLIHAVVLIPFCFALVMPKPKMERVAVSPESQVAEDSAHTSYKKVKIEKRAWLYVAFFILANFFAAAFMINVSTLVQGEGIGTAIDSSIMFSIQSIAGMIIGLVFGAVFARTKAFFPVITIGSFVIAFIGFSFGESLPILFAASPFFGIGYIGTITWCNTMISNSVHPSKAAFVVGVANAGVFISMFIYNFVISGVATVVGMVGNNRFAFYVSLGFYALFLVFTLAMALKSKEKIF